MRSTGIAVNYHDISVGVWVAETESYLGMHFLKLERREVTFSEHLCAVRRDEGFQGLQSLMVQSA